MAGKLGLVTKIVLGTSVLATGGTGTWYAVTHSFPSLGTVSTASQVDTDSAPTEPTTTNATPSDLDAVASAWAEAEPKSEEKTSSNAKSSPVARSADVTTATNAKSGASTAGDRYAMDLSPATTHIADTDSDSAKLKKDSEAEPASAEDKASTEADELKIAQAESQSVEPKAAEPETADVAEPEVAEPIATTDKTEPTPPEEPAKRSIARGQEPSEAAELQALAGDLGASDLQPLAEDTAPASTANSSAPARDAFREAANAGGRYGAADSVSVSAADAPTKLGTVNPFSAPPVNEPAANSQSVETLPRSNGTWAAPSDLPPLESAQPLREPAQTDRLPESPNALRSMSGTQALSAGANQPAANLYQPMANDLLANEGPTVSKGPEGSGKPGEKALEGPQRPSLEIQKFAPGEIQVGKPAKFVARVRNVGTQPAEGVVIEDSVPQGTKLISTTPEAQNSTGHLAWDLGKLSPGEERTVEMQVMPVAEGEIGSVATVSYSAQASVKTKCTMPQLAIRMTAPAKVMIGQQQRVKIELRNPGTGDATSVMLFENVPANVKHPAGPALEFEIGTLKAGETRELELVLLAEKAGKTVNVLSARADGNLQVQQQVEFEVIAPGLTVDVKGPERRYLERPATYEVRVDNPGTAPAHNVQIVTKLPPGLRFIRANNRGEYDASTHAVYWSLTELPEGENGIVELVAMPIEAGPQTLQVESKASQGLVDQAQQRIVVDGIAAIMFEVKDLEDPIEVGGETGYEIRVVNQGTKAATNVQVAVNLPPGLQFVSAEGETPHTDQRGAIVFQPLGQLAAKADTVYRIRARGTTAGDQRVTVQVNTDDLAQPIRREESTLVFGDE